MNKQPNGDRYSIYLRLIVVISAFGLLFLSLPINPKFIPHTPQTARISPTPGMTITVSPDLITEPPTPFPTESPHAVTPGKAQATLSVSNPDTLRFVFPSPGPLPISLWRPPPYDNPWAPSPHDHFYFTRPIAANEVNWPSPDYRYGGTVETDQHILHTGIDIGAPFGTPVLAAGSGTVVWAGFGLESRQPNPKDPYGMAVLIRHNFGFLGNRLETVYGHMSQLDVVEGQRVEAGTQIGLIGQTGLASGPHLHFEVRVEQFNYFAFQNPELWLVPPQGWGILAGKVMDSGGILIHRLDIQVTSKATGRVWIVRTYGSEAVKNDPYYQENVVLSDLPTGDYVVSIHYQDDSHEEEIHINPGRVSYFTFKGKSLFSTQPPPTPAAEFLDTLTPALK